jgi:hypothetical protein
MPRKKGGYVAPKPAGPQPITYIGMFPRVWVPEADMHVEQGETVQMPGDLVDRLLEQTDNWSKGRTPTPPPADEPEGEANEADEPDPEEEGPEEETE